MANTPDELLTSLIGATASGEIEWTYNDEEIRAALEETYGEVDELFSFLDEESGAFVVLASYQYVYGEDDENYLDGTSLILVDDEDFEVVSEITDEEVEDETLFAQLFTAVKGN